MALSATEKKVMIYQGDISDKAYEYLSAQDVLGCDTETNGLVPGKNELQLIQICTRDNRIALIQFRKDIEPTNINKLMKSSKTIKIFHNSRFDLGFLNHDAKSQFDKVFCTKLASQKVRNAKGLKHNLKVVTSEILNINIDKGFMDPNNLPDWTGELTEKHIEYATDDVVVLVPLFDYFKSKLSTKDFNDLLEASVNCATVYNK